MSVLETMLYVYDWMYTTTASFPSFTRDFHACPNNYVSIFMDYGEVCFFHMYYDTCLPFITESNDEQTKSDGADVCTYLM
jgi:hypothetical protein